MLRCKCTWGVSFVSFSAGPLSFAQSAKYFLLDFSMSSQRADADTTQFQLALWDPVQDHALLGAPSGPSHIDPTLHGTLRVDIL